MCRPCKHEVRKMKCKKAQKLLSAFLDNELSEEIRRCVGEHLEHCEQCSRLVNEAKGVFAWAGTWRAREASPFFLQRVRARIREAERHPAEAVPIWLPRLRRVLAGVAAACLIFFGGYLTHMGLFTGKDMSETVRPAEPAGKGVAAVTAPSSAGDARRLVAGIQRMKMVFGTQLSEAAYEQLNEAQRSLAQRGGPGTEQDLAVVQELQRAEDLVRREDYAEARTVLDGIEVAYRDHPLAPYARMTKVFAMPEEGSGGVLRDLYASLLRETVGDPKEYYTQLTTFPEQLREYGWQKIVKSAEQLNPANVLNYIEKRIAGGSETLLR